MNRNSATTLVMIFAKAPVPGKVKTRLIPALGKAGAANLHTQLLHHTLQTVARVETVDVQLYAQPDTRHAVFEECADAYTLSLKTQQGKDLGERMATAFAENLAVYEKVIIVGCDCPSLTTLHFQNAITALENEDAVLIPAFDGGYVLLGLRQYAPQLFQNIDWSTSRVLAQTRVQLQHAGLSWQELAPQHDIDRPDDLTHCPPYLLTGVHHEMAG